MWRPASALLMILICHPAAADGLLAGSLGRWLSQAVAPDLTETLSRHPKFRGETVRLVTMHDGQPAHVSNQLNRTVQAELRRHLLSADGVRLAWGDSAPACAAPRRINYLLGIGIERSGDNYRVTIAMVDVAEGVWVSGVNYSWEGRLTSAERKAFGVSHTVAAPGSLENPLPLAQTGAIAELLEAGLACVWPGGVDGAVVVVPAAQPDLARVSQRVAQKLAVSAVADVARQPGDAAWTLEVQRAVSPGPADELVLTLTDVQAGRTQRVASVYVTGLTDADRTPPRMTAVLDRLISPIRRDSGCPGDPECAEVVFDVRESAYLMVFRTANGRVDLTACDGYPDRRTAGEYRFRVHLPETASSPGRPDAGFYVIAVHDRGRASTLEQLLRAAPGACGHAAGGYQDWLARLERALEPDVDLDWRAIHLVRTPTGLASL